MIISDHEELNCTALHCIVFHSTAVVKLPRVRETTLIVMVESAANEERLPVYFPNSIRSEESARRDRFIRRSQCGSNLRSFSASRN